MNLNVLCAVFRRNFISYFTNATGYVFICVFVLLSSFAAFWPDEFFNTNLANLDQLNKYFPFIMLIFIPAITMSTWAEERREGTDELLLTIPALDMDLVLGKYFAAVAIVTVSLLFSMATNWGVLGTLGEPDWGQMAATYVGYWLVGVAMIAIGQVASFLTKNLTVAYILGALFNAPLVFAPMIGPFFPASIASKFTFWGIGPRFADFGNGVVSLSGITYFVAIAIVMVYLCVLLVGHRRWGHSSLAVHYPIRLFALAAIGVCFCTMFQLKDARWDWTVSWLSSLSDDTKDRLNDVRKADRLVQIEAFISPKVPESYVQTRMNLLNILREIEAYGGGKIQLKINATEKRTDEAAYIEQRYGIVPRQVTYLDHGAVTTDAIFLGIVVRSDWNRVTIPFVDRGIPIEYELIRSVCTVTEEKRKKIGVLATDAKLFGQFDMRTMSLGQNWKIVDELEKQYEVIQVDPKKPIEPGTVDAILAIQPSALGPAELDNFMAAIRAGIPTAIFEDPAPLMPEDVPATSVPRRPPNSGMSMYMPQTPPPKGKIGNLWEMLGVDFPPTTIVWQDFNPYPKMSIFNLYKEYVFIDKGIDTDHSHAFNPDSRISAGLQQIVCPFPGAFRKLNVSPLKFEPLALTSDKTGTSDYVDLEEAHQKRTQWYRQPTGNVYVLAAHITGTLAEEKEASEGKDVPEEKLDKKPEKADGKADGGGKTKSKVAPKINVVLFSDVDMIASGFFDLRAQGSGAGEGLDLNFNFDNVTFVLNALDALVGDERFIEIRNRRRYHPILTKIDKDMEEAKKETTEAREAAQKKFEQAIRQENKKSEKRFLDLQNQIKEGGVDTQAYMTQLAMIQENQQKRAKTIQETQQRMLDQEITRIETKQEVKIRSVQNGYKLGAVLLPPIPPLILALVVFCIRRVQERQGAVRGRMAKKVGQK